MYGLCIYIASLHVGLKRGGSPTKFFSPLRSNRSFSSCLLPLSFTFCSHSLMHLKNIAYTTLYASFNRLLWAVHMEHTRAHVQNARRHTRNHAFISRAIEHARSLSLSLSLFHTHTYTHTLSFSLSLSSVGSTVRLLCKTLLWHYVIHYGLRLRYILLYIATLTLSANADKVNTVSSPTLAIFDSRGLLFAKEIR